MMRFLFIDHYFSQDIQAMQMANNHHAVRVVPFSYFYQAARRVFPAPVFDGLETFHAPEYANARARWASAARRLLHELYLSFPFDAIIAPSDTFFYLRDVVAAAHELGMPFIVLQKETTIAPQTMATHAQNIGRWFPFIGDLMLVCSERHKQFWLNSGADPAKIGVTGQPRFDLYAHPEQKRSWADLGVRVSQDQTAILFFSYDLGAYSPEGEMIARTWEELRSQTEQSLIHLARQGYTILVKPHPQQNLRGEAQRLRALSGALWGRGVQLLDADLDTRHVILNADIVVAFQTTALFEAMAVSKPVIYTFWSAPVHRYAQDLIPFHQVSDALHCVTSPEELIAVARQRCGPIDAPDVVARRRKFFEEYLGPLDGNAGGRAWRQIEALTAASRATPARENLDVRAPGYCRAQLSRATLEAWKWSFVSKFVPIAYPIWQRARRLGHDRAELPSAAKFRENLRARACFMEQRAQDCRDIVVRRSATK